MIYSASSGFDVTSWSDIVLVVGGIAALSTALGAGVSAVYTKHKAKLERAVADDNASDRIIRLIEVEAEKKVEIVRTEFKLEIAQIKLQHAEEIKAMREEFESQLKSLRAEHDTFRCEHAPKCSWRFAKTPPPATVIG